MHQVTAPSSGSAGSSSLGSGSAGSSSLGSGSSLSAGGGTLALVEETLARYRLSGGLLASDRINAPTCSVAHGRAGVALGLYRIASATDDPALLALADAWSSSAIHRLETPAAFTNEELGMTPSQTGPLSTFYSVPGVYIVQSLLSQAMGDFASQLEAMAGFIELSPRDYRSVELTMGKSGTLLACAILNDASPGAGGVDMSPLVSFGHQLTDDIWAELDNYAPVGHGVDLGYLGIAHGWAGVLYAALRWRVWSGGPPPPSLPTRLQQLAECAVPAGQGARWPVETFSARPPAYMSGWCNGSAGYVHLWTLAHRIFGDDKYLTMAEKRPGMRGEPSSFPSLCCGLAGRAYGLVNLAQHTGDAKWLERARTLADLASHRARTELAGFEDSLYKGQLGVAVLLADLSRPETASLPFFDYAH